jgi:hypothetical protein
VVVQEIERNTQRDKETTDQPQATPSTTNIEKFSSTHQNISSGKPISSQELVDGVQKHTTYDSYILSKNLLKKISSFFFNSTLYYANGILKDPNWNVFDITSSYKI